MRALATVLRLHDLLHFLRQFKKIFSFLVIFSLGMNHHSFHHYHVLGRRMQMTARGEITMGMVLFLFVDL